MIETQEFQNIYEKTKQEGFSFAQLDANERVIYRAGVQDAKEAIRNKFTDEQVAMIENGIPEGKTPEYYEGLEHGVTRAVALLLGIEPSPPLPGGERLVMFSDITAIGSILLRYIVAMEDKGLVSK